MKLLLLCATALSLAACTNAADNSAADVESLMETSREWSKVAETGDMEKVAAYFADDAVMMSSGQPQVRGKQAIRAYLAEAKKIPGFKIRWEPLEGQVSGDMGYLLERTHMTMNRPDGTPVTDTMQAVTVWRKAPDGTWKNVVDAAIPGPQGLPTAAN
jgi:uncharacterized protein (TIGR02246 family)